MNILQNYHQRKGTYLLLSATLLAGVAIAAELMPEPVIDKVRATQMNVDNPTNAYTLEQSIAVDKGSQLTWSRCLIGQTFAEGACQGEPTAFTSWQDALNAAQVQAKDGWRLPNIKELMRITESTQVFPAINTSVFPFAKSFEFYNHDGAKEGTDYSKQVSRTDPNEVCTKVDYGRLVDSQGWQCVYPKLPAKYSPQVSAAYLWSSSPVAGWGDEESRQSANLVYALDLAEGTPTSVIRDGKAIGDTDNGQYSDEYKEKRARYVLLVKDVS